VSDINLLEAYSIRFTYENGLMHVSTAEGENSTANSVVLRGAKKDLYTLVNDVACMIQERDPLPGNATSQPSLSSQLLLISNSSRSTNENGAVVQRHMPSRLRASWISC
jgi:hypothetical protein